MGVRSAPNACDVYLPIAVLHPAFTFAHDVTRLPHGSACVGGNSGPPSRRATGTVPMPTAYESSSRENTLPLLASSWEQAGILSYPLPRVCS